METNLPPVREWVNCPICGESDMRKFGSVIHCVNELCATNYIKNGDALTDQELELWKSVVEADFAGAKLDESQKAYYFFGHRDAFTRMVISGRSLEEQANTAEKPVLLLVEPDEQDTANELMKAAIFGGMSPTAAKEAVEKVFDAGRMLFY